MNPAQEQSIESLLSAALGSNVVRFVPPSRDEAQASGGWAESLELIDQAAAFLKGSEQRVAAAEARAEKVAAKAMEGLKSAQQRVQEAEARTHEIERTAAEEARLAAERLARTEAWAQAAEERAREAEGRAEAAEARARNAEEWLNRLTDELKQKLAFAAAIQAEEGPLQALKMRIAG